MPENYNNFLGLASYYWRFVANFAKIASPLHKQACKQEKFQWNQQCQEAFVMLKQRLTTAPVLVFPNFEQPFVLPNGCKRLRCGSRVGAENV
jgi:hypothetical protein